MRFSILTFLLAAFSLAGCSPQVASTPEPGTTAEATQTTQAPTYPDLGAAPELTSDVWLNTDTPLRLANLRGKVVLLEMWTFGCINCQNVIPSLRSWHKDYASKGLVVIGNHYPEFSFEHELDRLQQAVTDLDIQYPVAQDNDGATWQAYKNHYWPTLYLIDKTGHLRYTHIGEGRYQEIEKAIQTLLAE